MTTSNFVNLFQAVGLFGLILTAISFVGLWIFTSRLDAEKEKKIREVERTAENARAGAQPVTHLSASVRLKGGGNKRGYNSERKDSGGHVAQLMFGQSSIMSKDRGPWIAMMVAEKVDLWGNEQTCEYFLDFRTERIFPTPHETVEEFLRKVDLFSIQPAFLDLHTDIVEGSVTLTVNSTVEKTFAIRPQNTGDFDVISNDPSRLHSLPKD